MYTFSLQRSRYIELMKNPLVFLRMEEIHTSSGWINYKWVPVDKTISGEVELEKPPRRKYTLVVADQVETEDENGTPKSVIKFPTRYLDLRNSEDCKLVINSFLKRSHDTEDKYPYIHFLWVLNHRNWTVDRMAEALRSYDSGTLDFVLYNGIAKIGKCLSYNKQQDIKQLMSAFGRDYNVYMPSIITDALKRISPTRDYEGLNIFELVNYILNTEVYQGQGLIRSVGNDTTNPLLCLYKWLNEDDFVIDHATLVSLFSIVSVYTRYNIVKRYMHDVKLKKTSFDPSILEAFINNPYEDFIRYRYCIFNPQMPVSLAVPLLCDCILTIHKTNGNAFQTFNGILDLAIQKSETVNPSVNLGLGSFICKCNGGAKYNPLFNGFIDYSMVYELDESKFTKENLTNSINAELRGGHPYKKNETPFGAASAEAVAEANIDKNKWCVSKMNCSLPKEVIIEGLYEDSNTCVIDINKLTPQVMADHIRSLASKCTKVGANRYEILSSHEIEQSLLIQYSKVISVRYTPNVGSVIGVQLEKCDIGKDDSTKLTRRIVESLKQELGVNDYNGVYFELPYNKEQHQRLLQLYYYNATDRISLFDDGLRRKFDDDLRRKFLKSTKVMTTEHFCAPKISDTPNRVTGLKFFWCRGHECYKNNLEKQELEKCKLWKDYTLYHMTEILGYKKIHETEIGLEPDKAISEFIGCVNKVNKKFGHLRCRSCGHLMHTDKGSGFNRYNYFSCSNPSCPEYHNSVYLNFCFKCKSGLIDSRETSKCPHGWYICPSCLACCDDAQYERQAQRYVLSNLPVPGYIKARLGTGHNDKNQYFCPKCGGAIEDILDDRNFLCKKCSQCGWYTFNYD